MVVAVDFDGVIHNPGDVAPGYRMGRPVPGAQDGMRQLAAAGHTLIVHTVRGDTGGHVSAWLRHFDIPFHGVTNVKPDADVYLDDKAVRFTTWVDALGVLA